MNQKEQILKRPVVTAIKLFDELGDDFDTFLPFYLTYGYVLSTPSCFVLAKRIESCNNIKDDFYYNDEGKILFVFYAVGEVKELCDYIPKDIEYICFYRRGKDRLKIYKLDKFLEKIK